MPHTLDPYAYNQPLCISAFCPTPPHPIPFGTLPPSIPPLFKPTGRVMLCQMPVGSGADFVGMVDLVTMTAVLYQAGADGLGKLRASAR